MLFLWAVAPLFLQVTNGAFATNPRWNELYHHIMKSKQAENDNVSVLSANVSPYNYNNNGLSSLQNSLEYEANPYDPNSRIDELTESGKADTENAIGEDSDMNSMTPYGFPGNLANDNYFNPAQMMNYDINSNAVDPSIYLPNYDFDGDESEASLSNVAHQSSVSAENPYALMQPYSFDSTTDKSIEYPSFNVAGNNFESRDVPNDYHYNNMGAVDPSTYSHNDPSTDSPNYVDPSTYLQNFFDSNAYSQNYIAPSTYSQNVFDPSTYLQKMFDLSTYSQNYIEPITYSQKFDGQDENAINSDAHQGDLVTSSSVAAENLNSFNNDGDLVQPYSFDSTTDNSIENPSFNVAGNHFESRDDPSTDSSNYVDPSTYLENFFDSNAYSQNYNAPSTYSQNIFDPSTYLQKMFDLSTYSQNYIEPIAYSQKFGDQDENALNSDAYQDDLITSSSSIAAENLNSFDSDKQGDFVQPYSFDSSTDKTPEFITSHVAGNNFASTYNVPDNSIDAVEPIAYSQNNIGYSGDQTESALSSDTLQDDFAASSNAFPVESPYAFTDQYGDVVQPYSFDSSTDKTPVLQSSDVAGNNFASTYDPYYFDTVGDYDNEPDKIDPYSVKPMKKPPIMPLEYYITPAALKVPGSGFPFNNNMTNGSSAPDFNFNQFTGYQPWAYPNNAKSIAGHSLQSDSLPKGFSSYIRKSLAPQMKREPNSYNEYNLTPGSLPKGVSLKHYNKGRYASTGKNVRGSLLNSSARNMATEYSKERPYSANVVPYSTNKASHSPTDYNGMAAAPSFVPLNQPFLKGNIPFDYSKDSTGTHNDESTSINAPIKGNNEENIELQNTSSKKPGDANIVGYALKNNGISEGKIKQLIARRQQAKKRAGITKQPPTSLTQQGDKITKSVLNWMKRNKQVLENEANSGLESSKKEDTLNYNKNTTPLDGLNTMQDNSVGPQTVEPQFRSLFSSKLRKKLQRFFPSVDLIEPLDDNFSPSKNVLDLQRETSEFGSKDFFSKMDFDNSESLLENKNIKPKYKSLNRGRKSKSKRRKFHTGGKPNVKQQSGIDGKLDSSKGVRVDDIISRAKSHHKEQSVAKSYSMSSSELDGKKVSVMDANKAVKAKVKLDDGDNVHVMSAEDLTMFKSLPLQKNDKSTSGDVTSFDEFDFDAAEKSQDNKKRKGESEVQNSIPLDEEENVKGKARNMSTDKKKKQKLESKIKSKKQKKKSKPKKGIKNKNSNLMSFKSLLSADTQAVNDIQMDFHDPKHEVDGISTPLEANNLKPDSNNMNGIATPRFMSFPPRVNAINPGQQMSPYFNQGGRSYVSKFNEPENDPYILSGERQISPYLLNGRNSQVKNVYEPYSRHPMSGEQMQNNQQSPVNTPVEYRKHDVDEISDSDDGTDSQMKYQISEHFPPETQDDLIFNNEDAEAKVSPLNADVHSPGFDQTQNTVEKDKVFPESLDFKNKDNADFHDQSHLDDIDDQHQEIDPPQPAVSPVTSPSESDGHNVSPMTSDFKVDSSFSFGGLGLGSQLSMSSQYSSQDSVAPFVPQELPSFSASLNAQVEDQEKPIDFMPFRANSISGPASGASLTNDVNLNEIPSDNFIPMKSDNIGVQVEQDKVYYPMVSYALKRPKITNMDKEMYRPKDIYNSYSNGLGSKYYYKFPLYQPKVFKLPFNSIRPCPKISLQELRLVSSWKQPPQPLYYSLVPRTTFTPSYQGPMNWYTRSFTAADGILPLRLHNANAFQSRPTGVRLWRYLGCR